MISSITKGIQQYWIELFGTELGLLDTNQQKGSWIELFDTELALLDTNQQKGLTDSIQTPDTSRTEYQGSIDLIQTQENIRRQ